MSTTWQWIVTNSAGVQSVIAFFAFVVLCKYAWDTRTVAQAASNQTKDGVMPFIAIDLTSDAGEAGALPNARSWKMENQGAGPAINVKIWLLNDETPKQRFSVMKGSIRKLLDFRGPENELFHDRLQRPEGVKAEYESLAKERFRSTFRMVGTEIIEVTFENISRD
jgi:hypothetical protein